ncbi:hypothetical protein VTI74DRAFT_1775 [Chaetomium olivicolor]
MTSELKEEGQPTQPQAGAPPNNTERTDPFTALKRSPDAEIQFISSKPVKKRKLTEQKPGHIHQPAATPPPQAPIKHDILTPPQSSPIDRCRSTSDVGQKGYAPGLVLDTRGASVPVFQNFAFPQSFAPVATQPRRDSDAISPKQLPQLLPSPSESDAVADQQPIPVPAPPSQNSVTLDQISCLDFNGVPTNTPGFDASRIFSAEGGIFGGYGAASTNAATQALPAFNHISNALASHNAIPFAIYSTGNIVPMPQAQILKQPSASFGSVPMQTSPQTAGVPIPGLPEQQPSRLPQSDRPAVGSSAIHRSSSPAPGAKTPCLHCLRIQQEGLLRQAQASSRMPGGQLCLNTQHLARHSQCHHRPSPGRASCHSQPVPPTHRGLAPRSTPALQRQQQPPQQQQPTPSFPAPWPNPALPANLVADIAETIQATFPCAQVAARHGVPAVRVAEVVSGMVLSPLLRGGPQAPTLK